MLKMNDHKSVISFVNMLWINEPAINMLKIKKTRNDKQKIKSICSICDSQFIENRIMAFYKDKLGTSDTY